MITPSMLDPSDRAPCSVETYQENGKVALCISSEMEITTVMLEPGEAAQIARAIIQQAIQAQNKLTTKAT